MAAITFQIFETQVSDEAGNAVAGPVANIIGPYSTALEQSLTRFFDAASGGRIDADWLPAMTLRVPQTLPQWAALDLKGRIAQVRAQAQIPDGTQILLVSNDALPAEAATPVGRDPYVHADWLSPAMAAHEMGHFFQWAGTGLTGHADVATEFFRDEYADLTCIMGGGGVQLSFTDWTVPQLPLKPGSRRSGPMMNPAMADLCGWIDPAAPGVDEVDPVGLGSVFLRPYVGAPRAGDQVSGRTLAIIDGFAPDRRVYICLRSPRGWDRGFGSLFQPLVGPPVPHLCVYLSTPSGDSLCLARQPAIGGAVVPAGHLPLEIAVFTNTPEGLGLELRRRSWRGWSEIEGVQTLAGAQIAAAAWEKTADLYVLDTAGQVRYNHYNGHGWEHTPWPHIDGITCDPAGGIAAAAPRQGLVEVYVTDLAGVVHRRQRMDRTWSPAWDALPGGGLNSGSPLAAARLADDIVLVCGVRSDRQVSRALIGPPGVLGDWNSAPRLDAGRIAATPAEDAQGRTYAVHQTNTDRSLWSTPDIANPDPNNWGVVGQILFDDPARSIAATCIVDGRDVVLAGTDPLMSLNWDGADWLVDQAQPLGRAADGGIAIFSREKESFDAVAIDSDGIVRVTSWSPRTDYRPATQQYKAESHVVLFTYDGYHLVQAKNGGGDGIGAEALAIGPWERFRMLELGSHVINGGGTRRMVALQAHNGQYVGAVGGGGSHLVAEATQIGPWEHFYLNQVSGSPLSVTFGCINEKHFWTAVGGGGAAVGADKPWEKEWERFMLVTVPPA